MAQGDSSDLMMKFVRKGKAIPAEGTTELTPANGVPNPLVKGFKPGFMFEIERFSFKSGIIDEDSKNAEKNKPKDKNKTAAASSKRGSFQSWRSGDMPKLGYPVELQPVTFTRAIDFSSALLMQNCIDCESYDSASLIKRKAAGGGAAGEVFLRLDFGGVLVIKVDWDNDDEVKENISFICRSIFISYRPQLPNGRLGRPITGAWKMENASQIAIA